MNLDHDLLAIGTFLTALGGFIAVCANVYIGIKQRRMLSTQIEITTNGQTRQLLAATAAQSHAEGKAEGVESERTRKPEK